MNKTYGEFNSITLQFPAGSAADSDSKLLRSEAPSSCSSGHNRPPALQTLQHGSANGGARV